MKFLVVYFSFILLSFGARLSQGSDDDERKPYIVYMGEKSPEIKQLARVQHHHGLLVKAVGDVNVAREVRIHSYGKSFNAFAARLLPSEAARLSEDSGVISVFPSSVRELLTTRSWDFIGMQEDVIQRQHTEETNTIIGVLDTGIYVEAPSFNDKGFGPIPRKWKGRCDKGKNFTGCNRKVIGARFYNLGGEYTGMDPTPADTDGHGTHTSSTAAGGVVKGASLNDVAKGTARGAVPGARIAMYKVCGAFGCSDLNLLAAMDDAISDGVDVISISIGGPSKSFLNDVIAIGSFHALRKGILTVCAGGNDGPDEGTVGNVAPWILTVGSTTMDREFRTTVKLGNGKKINGISINTFASKKTMIPLISSASAFNGTNPYTNASSCNRGTLEVRKVKNKIVFCKGYSGADYSVRLSKGAGTIISLDDITDTSATTSFIPASIVSVNDGNLIDLYINTTKSPQAFIYKTKTINLTKAPVVASFSARGPQKFPGNILKPDIAAPGVGILAAHSKLVSITGETFDSRKYAFNIMSGTSMSCPQVAGAAAYVRTFHPTWSPAAIKSALMTTARPVNGDGKEKPLASGSGLLNPAEAAHPGLIYDLSTNDYIRFLCKAGFNGSTLAKLSSFKKIPHFNCTKFNKAQGTDGINYPSMHFQLALGESTISAQFQRTVTYVGLGPSVFKAKVLTGHEDMSVKVVPDVLAFNKAQEKTSFRVEVEGAFAEDNMNNFSAFLEWSDGKHKARSPILIYRHVIE